jgi:hypothetical protein
MIEINCHHGGNMSTNPDHINQLTAIIFEVGGNHWKGVPHLAEAILSHPGSSWHPPAALAQPEGEGPSFAEVDELCAEFGFHLDYYQGEPLEILQEMIGAALARWGRPAAPPAPEAGEGRWSEGVCGDGAAILFDGVMVPIEQVVRALNRTPATTAAL